jgi:hypothetical protein
MTLPQINTQRGVPYKPGAAVKARQREAEKAERVQLDVEGARLKAKSELSPRKAHAIMLDQIEHAWRERARDRRRS